MNDAHVGEKLERVTLPPSYTWGTWSGDYRAVMRGDREICRVGGVIAKCEPEMKGEVYRAILKGEWEWSQTDKLLAFLEERK